MEIKQKVSFFNADAKTNYFCNFMEIKIKLRIDSFQSELTKLLANLTVLDFSCWCDVIEIVRSHPKLFFYVQYLLLE